MRDNRRMWFWKRRSFGEGFPPDFRVQRIGVSDALAVAELRPDQIADHFRKRPWTADALLQESYDKRYSPSTYLMEQNDEFSVGWCSRKTGYQCERRFSDLADAATDYLLFSLGKGRWTAPASEKSD
jgi:hypothetical protein